MDINNKKEMIIQKIESTTRQQLIEEVYDVLFPDEEINNIPVENLPKELQNKISRALDDYKSGRYITDEQMKETVNQWLTS